MKVCTHPFQHSYKSQRLFQNTDINPESWHYFLKRKTHTINRVKWIKGVIWFAQLYIWIYDLFLLRLQDAGSAFPHCLKGVYCEVNILYTTMLNKWIKTQHLLTANGTDALEVVIFTFCLKKLLTRCGHVIDDVSLRRWTNVKKSNGSVRKITVRWTELALGLIL